MCLSWILLVGWVFCFCLCHLQILSLEHELSQQLSKKLSGLQPWTGAGSFALLFGGFQLGLSNQLLVSQLSGRLHSLCATFHIYMFSFLGLFL